MDRTKWVLDLAHSSIEFKIRHLLIATITGHFRAFSGVLYASKDDFTDAKFEIIVDVYSIDTNNADRDEHLKSPDFFNADYHPEMHLRSNSFDHIEGDNYKLNANVTIKGITKQVTLDALFGGEAKDGFGTMRAGFEIFGVVDRNDYNIHSDDVTEAGRLVLGEDIKVHGYLQFIKQAD